MLADEAVGMDEPLPPLHHSPATPTIPLTVDTFNVHLNVQFTKGLTRAQLKALSLEFADWCPGPVLLPRGTAVKLSPDKIFEGMDYNGCDGEVVQHSSEDPHRVVVCVDCVNATPVTPGASVSPGKKTCEVWYSILQCDRQKKAHEQCMQQAIDKLLDNSPEASAGSGPAAIIGYSEFSCGNSTEREYWLSLDSTWLGPVKPGDVNSKSSSKMCAIHVQYAERATTQSEVERVSIRVTSSMELRAHQDKCRECATCKLRAACEQCKGSYKVHQKCYVHYNCHHCPEFKWQEVYGRQFRKSAGPKDLCRVMALIHTLAKDCSFQAHSLDDAQQRRFAFVLGNASYPKESMFGLLKGVEMDVTNIAKQLKELGFRVHNNTHLINLNRAKLEREVERWTRSLPENAEALIFLSGHGMMHSDPSPPPGEKHYFISIDCAAKKGPKFAETVQNTCCTLEWIQGRVLDFALRHEGLLMSFWDCCSTYALNGYHPASQYIGTMRGGGSDSMRGSDKLDLKFEMKTRRSATQLTVFGSASGTHAYEETESNTKKQTKTKDNDAHQGREGGILAQALLAWWKDSDCIACNIHDEKIYNFLYDHCKRGDKIPEQQELRWVRAGGVTAFVFKKGVVSDAGNQQCECQLEAERRTLKVQQREELPIETRAQAPTDTMEMEQGLTSADSMPDTSLLPAPNSVPSGFNVMFVGANTDDHEKLKVQKESKAMREALVSEYGEQAWHSRGVFNQDCFAERASFIRDVMQLRPSILHFSCHGEKRGLWLSSGLLEIGLLVENLARHNKDIKSRCPIQLVIVNACKSGSIASALSGCVDFVIGHGEHDVSDEEAREFSKTLFKALGAGRSLGDSFMAAKLASGKYDLYRRFNPELFVLPVPPLALSDAKADDEVEAEVVTFLRKHGFSEIAKELQSELGLEEVTDIWLIKRKDLKKFEWLKAVPRRKLLKLVKKVIAAAHSVSSPRNDNRQEVRSPANTRNDNLDVSNLSGADTLSEIGCTTGSEDDTHFVVWAVKHPGNPEEFPEHMKCFLKDFKNCVSKRESSIVPIMLVWQRFAKEAHFDEYEKRIWLEACHDSPTQKGLMRVLQLVLMRKKTDPPLWDCTKFETLRCEKEFSAAVFVTAMMVRRHLQRHSEMFYKWEQDVVHGWFQNDDTASEFLDRANKFLRTQIDGIGVVTHVIKIQSYVAFLRMSKIASLLLFEYVDVRKSQDAAGTGAAKQRAGVSHELLRGFSSFVSSAGHVFRLSNADIPARSAIKTIIEGLRCLAHLGDPQWDVKTASELFDANLPQVAAPTQQKAHVDDDDSDDDSDDDLPVVTSVLIKGGVTSEDMKKSVYGNMEGKKASNSSGGLSGAPKTTPEIETKEEGGSKKRAEASVDDNDYDLPLDLPLRVTSVGVHDTDICVEPAMRFIDGDGDSPSAERHKTYSDGVAEGGDLRS